jgi:hypothetical protein
MTWSPRRWQRCGRALSVVLALVANLFATGVPLLHALAHEHEHAHREAHAAGHEHPHEGGHHEPSRQREEHDGIHPAALHEECLVVPRAKLDPAPALRSESLREPVSVAVEAPASPATVTLRSRAPPRATPARAPPLV